MTPRVLADMQGVMDLILAYAAGLLTLINPCVLPILPIVLAGSLQTSRAGPVLIAAGMSVTFVALGMFVTVLGYGIGITEETIVTIGAVVMTGFGLILLVPAFSARFATATAGFASGADAQIDSLDSKGAWRHVAIGALMAAVWSPCIGPTMGAAIGLASQGESLVFSAGIMTFFAFGVSTIILLLGYGARSVILRRQALMRVIAEKSRPILGIVFVLVGLAILFDVTKAIEIWMLQNLPAWLVDFSVSL